MKLHRLPLVFLSDTSMHEYVASFFLVCWSSLSSL